MPVLVFSLLILLTQVAGKLAEVPAVADYIGEFTAPVLLPGRLNIVVTVVAVAASVERALRLRYSRLLDGVAG